MSIVLTYNGVQSTRTVQNILDRAGRLLSVINSGESLTPDESADALMALNAMMDSWRNDRLMCYAIQDQSFSLVATQQQYTVGPSGTALATTRPVRIEQVYVVDVNGISYGVDILDEEQWAGIINKSQTTASYPQRVWVQPNMDNVTFYVHPIPSASLGTLHFLDYTPVTGFNTVGDTIDLPPGWEEALASNLALVIAPEFEVQPSPLVQSMATTSKAAIKRVNGRPIRLQTELARMTDKRNVFNVYTGQ
jgi:hypothetical protein